MKSFKVKFLHAYIGHIELLVVGPVLKRKTGFWGFETE